MLGIKNADLIIGKKNILKVCVGSQIVKEVAAILLVEQQTKAVENECLHKNKNNTLLHS